ncbi:MAG: AraC family transcriptional regulator [bacterium]
MNQPPTSEKLTYSCVWSPGLALLEEVCIMGGYWRVTEHRLQNRLIDEIVLIACMSGKGWLMLNGTRFSINAGDLFYCPASIPHSYGCESGGWEIYWAHGQGRHTTALCEAAGLDATTPVHPLAHHVQVQEAFRILVAILATEGPDSSWIAARNFHNLLHTLVWCHHKPTGKQRLAELVKADCENLDELVKASGYSRFHFCRLFKEETGQSPWQYVMERKLERARELLLGSKLSIKEIATQLGFEHPDYFTRLFSRSIGVTPMRYRGNLGKPLRRQPGHARVLDAPQRRLPPPVLSPMRSPSEKQFPISQ